VLLDAPAQVHFDVAEDRDKVDAPAQVHFDGAAFGRVDAPAQDAEVAEDSEMKHENHDSLGGVLVEGTGSEVDVALADLLEEAGMDLAVDADVAADFGTDGPAALAGVEMIHGWVVV